MSDIAPINEKDVSLFRLKSELVELMQLRENDELSPEEQAAIDGQIKAYVGAELRKVDNIRAYLRHCDVMAEAAQEEANRLSSLIGTWKRRRDKLKDLCKDLMIESREKKLEGLHGSISLKGNGGLQPLEISQPAMIPEAFVLYRGWMSSEAMAEIPELVRGRQDFQFEREPIPGIVRAALKQPCEPCKGTGESMDLDRIPVTVVCPHCGGDGKRHVAGARLQERGSHIEIR